MLKCTSKLELIVFEGGLHGKVAASRGTGRKTCCHLTEFNGYANCGVISLKFLKYFAISIMELDLE